MSESLHESQLWLSVRVVAILCIGLCRFAAAQEPAGRRASHLPLASDDLSRRAVARLLRRSTAQSRMPCIVCFCRACGAGRLLPQAVPMYSLLSRVLHDGLLLPQTVSQIFAGRSPPTTSPVRAAVQRAANRAHFGANVAPSTVTSRNRCEPANSVERDLDVHASAQSR